MSDTGRGSSVLQRAIEMAELGDHDAQKLIAVVRGDVEPLRAARAECAAALEHASRNRERLEAVLELLDAAVRLATPPAGAT